MAANKTVIISCNPNEAEIIDEVFPINDPHVSVIRQTENEVYHGLNNKIRFAAWSAYVVGCFTIDKYVKNQKISLGVLLGSAAAFTFVDVVVFGEYRRAEYRVLTVGNGPHHDVHYLQTPSGRANGLKEGFWALLQRQLTSGNDGAKFDLRQKDSVDSARLLAETKRILGVDR